VRRIDADRRRELVWRQVDAVEKLRPNDRTRMRRGRPPLGDDLDGGDGTIPPGMEGVGFAARRF